MKNMNKIQSPLARFVSAESIKKDEIINVKKQQVLAAII
jgi:hypothetical protein